MIGGYMTDFTEACYAVSKLINSTLSLPLVFKEINTILKKILPAENMFVSVLENSDQLRFPFYVDQIEAEDPLKVYKKEGFTSYILDTGKTLWTKRDHETLEKISCIGPTAVDWIGCPLKDKAGKTFGVFAVQSYDIQKTYTEPEREFLEFIADLVSLVIQSRNNERELAIHKISALVDEITDIEELYPKIHDILKPVIPAALKSMIIVLADEEKGVFIPVYWQDEKDDYTDFVWQLENGFCGYIYNFSRESFIYQKGLSILPPEVINTVGSPPVFWLGVPLFIGTKVIGILYTQTYSDMEIITKEDQAALKAIAPHIALAINRARFQGYYIS